MLDKSYSGNRRWLVAGLLVRPNGKKLYLQAPRDVSLRSRCIRNLLNFDPVGVFSGRPSPAWTVFFRRLGLVQYWRESYRGECPHRDESVINATVDAIAVLASVDPWRWLAKDTSTSLIYCDMRTHSHATSSVLTTAILSCAGVCSFFLGVLKIIQS